MNHDASACAFCSASCFAGEDMWHSLVRPDWQKELSCTTLPVSLSSPILIEIALRLLNLLLFIDNQHDAPTRLSPAEDESGHDGEDETDQRQEGNPDPYECVPQGVVHTLTKTREGKAGVSWESPTRVDEYKSEGAP